MNVKSLAVSDWNKDGTIVKVTNVTFDDGSVVPGYDLPPDQIAAGKPLPEGWEIATAKSGKPYIKVPKAGGRKGGFEAAFRNTKEGQAYEQERMDRRTALMQAVAYNAPDAPLFHMADDFYTWLRASTTPPGADGAAGAVVTKPAASKTSAADEGPARENAGKEIGAAADAEWGAGAETPARGGGTCSSYADHTFKKRGENTFTCTKCGVNRT